MKLYLVKRTDRIGYDEYDACVVRAESEALARLTHPCVGISVKEYWNGKNWVWKHYGGAEYSSDTWAPPDTLTVVYLGEAESEAPGVVLASFCAG